MANTLSDVKVGELVWVRYFHPHWDADHEVEIHLAPVTHIDKKGRIYICSPEPYLIKNFRYGFNPVTGVSPYNNYKGYILSFATKESIEAENLRKSVREAADLKAQEEIKAERLIEAAAHLMYDALVEVQSILLSIAPNRSGNYAAKERGDTIISAALRMARGE